MKRIMIRFLLTAPLAFSLPLQIAAAADWHVDDGAGIRFRIPFSNYLEKTGQQVEGLLMDDPAYRRMQPSLPAGLIYTSGVYARGSEAFLLVWTTPRTELPSRAALRALSSCSEADSFRRFGVRGFQFDAEMLRGTGRQPLRNGMRSRVLVQLAKDATIYVGFYFTKAVDEARFEPVLASFELMPARRIAVSELPRGIPAAVRTMLVAAAAAFAVLGTALIIRRVWWRRPQ